MKKKEKEQLEQMQARQIQLGRDTQQTSMLYTLQEYFATIHSSGQSQTLAGQALAYIEALKLWQRERNELFLPRFIAYEERKGLIQRIKDYFWKGKE